MKTILNKNYQPIENCILARLSETQIENLKGLEAIIVTETARTIASMLLNIPQTFSQGSKYLLRAVKEN